MAPWGVSLPTGEAAPVWPPHAGGRDAARARTPVVPMRLAVRAAGRLRAWGGCGGVVRQLRGPAGVAGRLRRAGTVRRVHRSVSFSTHAVAAGALHPGSPRADDTGAAARRGPHAARASPETPSSPPPVPAPTIYAVASGRPPPAATNVYQAMCGSRAGSPLPQPRRARVCKLRHPDTREVLDEALVLWFPAPHSFTGDATLELHVHGGAAVVRDVFEALVALSARDMHLRPALPGEFTRRAFVNGRMDLASCEALDALLRAETSTQRRLALSVGGGRQRERYEALRTRLRSGMAQLEAMLDFSDEDDVDAHTWAGVEADVGAMRALLQRALGGAARRAHADVVTSGAQLVLYGRPNAGKSSLLNRAAERDAAIVSPVPGTTRDAIQVAVELAGYRVHISDTAGLRDGAVDAIEAAGMERAKALVHAADLALCVCSAPQVFDALGYIPREGAAEVDAGIAAALGLERPARSSATDPFLVFVNKMDLAGGAGEECSGGPGATSAGGSDDRGASTGRGRRHDASGLRDDRGVDALLGDLGTTLAAWYAADESEAPFVTQARHRHLLQEIVRCLDAFLAIGPSDVVLAAEELRRAAHLVGHVTGATLGADEVLGEIFARFCIGK
ncbi:mitochondrial splicing system protein [Malassezia sp. CBS 17886]|nr:mitochondrial splicing system protein [Malassezia sp. CBS 17886]